MHQTTSSTCRRVLAGFLTRPRPPEGVGRPQHAFFSGAMARASLLPTPCAAQNGLQDAPNYFIYVHTCTRRLSNPAPPPGGGGQTTTCIFLQSDGPSFAPANTCAENCTLPTHLLLHSPTKAANHTAKIFASSLSKTANHTEQTPQHKALPAPSLHCRTRFLLLSKVQHIAKGLENRIFAKTAIPIHKARIEANRDAPRPTSSAQKLQTRLHKKMASMVAVRNPGGHQKKRSSENP